MSISPVRQSEALLRVGVQDPSERMSKYGFERAVDLWTFGYVEDCYRNVILEN